MASLDEGSEAAQGKAHITYSDDEGEEHRHENRYGSSEDEDEDQDEVHEMNSDSFSGNYATAEEAEEAVRMIGQTPMLDSVQKMLRDQQLKELKDKELAKKDLEEDLRRASKNRENMGVKLYGLQQQLATLQLKLEESHAAFQETTETRVSAEGESNEKKLILEEFVHEVKQAEEKLKATKQEENAAKAAVKQVEAFLEETRGEIAVMRRATHKTEESVAQLEKKKTEQDLYIDSRVERLSQLQEEIALIEAQRQSQAIETKSAEKTLREASEEMNTTVFEKRQVMAQWNSTLIALQRRDEAYQSMVDAIKAKQEEKRTIESEIQGFRKSAQEVQYESERLVERKVRQEHSLKLAEDSLASHERAYSKLSERFSLLKKTIEQQDAEARRLRGSLASVKKELKSFESQTQLVERQRHEVEREITSLGEDKVTATKASRNLSREAGKLQKKIHTAELEIASVENETARIRIDKLTTQSHAEQLQLELDSRLEELSTKDKLIEKYKAEIRQRHDQIEKRTYVVDRLNRKLEKMMSNKDEPECLGPLEATIKNLGREATALSQQNRELERQWLRLQTEFVNVVSEMETESTNVHELSSTETILLQKRKRLDNKIASQNNELKQLDVQVRRMHNDMHKLNEMIADHKGKHEELVNTNQVMQADFVAELKELEHQSVEAEATIERIKMEKQTLLDEIMESERQTKLWEKKIQLEKDTQQALDPSVGQSEVQAMEKEIHRMRLRHDTLVREQERMIKEMETAILKRETISIRKQGAANKAPRKRTTEDSIGELTQAELARKLKFERKELKRFSKECSKYEKEISRRRGESDAASMELEKASNLFTHTEDEIARAKHEINDKLYQKQRNIETLSRLRTLGEKYVEFARNPVHEQPVAQEEAELLLDESKDQISAVVSAIKAMTSNLPHLADVLDRVTQLVDTT